MNTYDGHVSLEDADRLVGSEVSPMIDELDYFRASDFEGRPVPYRGWLVDRFIPAGNPTLLGGDGGTGKSLLGLQLCAAACLDRPWLGLPVKQGKSLYVSAEDDKDELHRRFNAIAASEGARLGDMHGITIRCLAGQNALLAVPDVRSGKMLATPLFHDIGRMIEQLQPVVVVLDSLADIYGGNENDRAQVRQFVGMLRGWSIRYGCSILMLAHPSLTGISSGTGFSGSTAWNNSVRSRLYFTRDQKASSGEPADPDARKLEVMKANYGAIGDSIRVRWRDGVFVVDGERKMDFVSRVAAQHRADEMFLGLLSRLTAQGRQVSDAPGRNYAPNIFAEQPDNGTINSPGFKAAMDRLFADGKIKVELDGPPSKQRRFLTQMEATL